MRYFVQHVTRFRYSSPVHESLTEVRMAPRTEAHQRCYQFRLQCKPSVQVMRYDDHYGNVVYHFDVPTPHTSLEIVAASAVEIEPLADLPAKLPAEAWRQLDELGQDGEFWDWLHPSRFAVPTKALESLAVRLKLGERKADPLTSVQRICSGIHRHFTYKPEATEVDSPIDMAIKLRSGVCQDFAHIAIAMLRRLGIPARYVSGYLFHNGSDRNTAANASHAWVEVYLPPLGWIGVDPTNDVVVGEKHIRVAVGRDYADVSPTRGVYKGDAESELAVAVSVSATRGQSNSDLALHVIRRNGQSAAKSEPQEVHQQQ
ncbi:MAG TPA: transglutaminase family protein [Candidatus Sulfotelmatobacter sp.]|nr:transglutaminase family protein [Candidatus Sulfotelmatobacter sp.]